MDTWHLEYKDDKTNSSKFYRVVLAGSYVGSAWGRRGASGQRKLEDVTSRGPAAAARRAQSLVSGKIQKGYVLRYVTDLAPMALTIEAHWAAVDAAWKDAVEAEHAATLAGLERAARGEPDVVVAVPEWTLTQKMWNWAEVAARLLGEFDAVVDRERDVCATSIPAAVEAWLQESWPGGLLGRAEGATGKDVLDTALSLWGSSLDDFEEAIEVAQAF